MATRATESVDTDGLAATYHAASAGGDKVAPSESCFLHVKNGGGSPVTVTLVTPGTVDSLAITDRTVSVPATTGERFIKVPASIYRDPADGLASITWSGTTSVTFAVLQA
jgi:hypothetical protein